MPPTRLNLEIRIIKERKVKLRALFRRSFSTYEGEPPSLYRLPDEIRCDIRVIKSEIAKITASLNIRNILTEAIANLAEKNPEIWVGELRDLCDEAEEALASLEELNSDLDLLREELEEAKWIVEQ